MVRAIVFIALLAIGAAVRGAETVGVPPKTTVMVLPFTLLNDEQAHQWIGYSIMLGLEMALEKEPTLSTVSNTSVVVPEPGAVANRAAIDEPTMVKLAQKAGASLLIVGSYQIVGNQVGATGRILNPELFTTPRLSLVM